MQAAQAMGEPISEELAGSLATFASQLRVWNKTHSLTRLDTSEALVEDHTLDALAALPLLAEALQGTPADAHLLDVGSGNGYPAIPLALAMPQRHFGMVERVGRKAAFLRSAAAKLGLASRVRVYECDVTRLQGRDLPGGSPPAVILSRAYAAPLAFVSTTRHLAGPQTRHLYWAGASELARWHAQEFPQPITDNLETQPIESARAAWVQAMIQRSPGKPRPRAFLWLSAFPPPQPFPNPTPQQAP